MLISVIVCTYNRCDLLEQVMQTLVNQTLQKGLFEIIIIDNNSKDNTSVVSNLFIKNNPDMNIKYIIETNQGLSHARNRGWREAKGDYVAYTDDDCKIPKNWLEVAKEVIDQIQPSAFGGPYYAFYLSPKPFWFKDEYGSHVQGSKSRPLKEKEYLDGANLFIRRDILELLEGFNPALGMSGNKIAYGEETSLLASIRKKVPKSSIYYEPKLYVYHLVSEKKMILSWSVKNRFISGIHAYKALEILEKKNYFVNLLYTIMLSLCGILLIILFFYDMTFGTMFRNRSRYPFFQNYFYEHSFKLIEIFGICWGYILGK